MRPERRGHICCARLSMNLREQIDFKRLSKKRFSLGEDIVKVAAGGMRVEIRLAGPQLVEVKQATVIRFEELIVLAALFGVRGLNELLEQSAHFSGLAILSYGTRDYSNLCHCRFSLLLCRGIEEREIRLGIEGLVHGDRVDRH